MKDEKLYRILDACTTSIRPDEGHRYPHLIKVDVVFMLVGVDKAKAEAHRQEFTEWMLAFPDKKMLAGGPAAGSYFKVGKKIGDQDGALRFFALGHVLELWEVVTPEDIGWTGQKAATLAESGGVYTTGWVDPKQHAELMRRVKPSKLPAMWLRP